MNRQIISALKTSLSKSYSGVSPDLIKWNSHLSKPPKRSMGDIAFVCSELANTINEPPLQVASLIAANLPHLTIVKNVKATGPYINFFFDRGMIIRSVCEQIVQQGACYGHNASMQGQKVMVEFSSPNTNKPLHLGHLRNTLLGDALASILQANSANVIRANLINDRGIHICKTLLAYQKWGNEATPESLGIKGDHYVGGLYVSFEQAFKKEVAEMQFNQEDFEDWIISREITLSGLTEKEIKMWREDYDRSRSHLYQKAQDLLKRWEEGDEEIRRLWETMNKWVIDGFKETYAKLNVLFDRCYMESEIYSFGKDLVENGLTRGIFEKDTTGAVIADLCSEGLGKKVMLRPDGTTIYITQDLGASVLKQNDYNLTSSICVVAREQEYHFNVLVKILELLGYKWANNIYHLSYGLVHLPNGRMKSREGTVVDIDDFLHDLFILALKEVKARENISGKNSQQLLAQAISLSAAKFGFLSVSPVRDTIFDPKASISFKGYTGPYVQYANVRAKGILSKAGEKKLDVTCTAILVSDMEMDLALMLADYPAIVKEGGRQRDPSIVVNYLYYLSQKFNSFYHMENVLKEKNEERRRGLLILCATTSQVLVNGLKLLGIEAPEIM